MSQTPTTHPKNLHLGAAKAAKNDEFYTVWADIEREMNAYLEYDPDVFRDKVILLSTHILEEVQAVCTRAIIIAAGRLLLDGLVHLPLVVPPVVAWRKRRPAVHA